MQTNMTSQLDNCNRNSDRNNNVALLNSSSGQSHSNIRLNSVNCSQLLLYDSVQAAAEAAVAAATSSTTTTIIMSNDTDLTLDSQASILGIRALLDPDNYPLSYKHALTTRNILIIAFYTSIVFVSLFGNLFVCYVIVKRKRMQTSTNILMANLAVSDLLMTIINIPFNIARILLNEWPFGSTLCVLVPLVQVTSVYVSTLTMTVIAIDRYQAIINPLEKRLSTTVSISIIIFFIWVASAIFSTPNVVFNRVVEVLGHKQILRCRAVYPQLELSYRRFITMFTFLTQYAIPLSITAFAYIRISFYIWHKLSNPVNKRCSTNLPTEKLNNNNTNTNNNAMHSPNDYMEQSSTFNLQNDLHTTKHTCYYLNNVNQFHKRSRRKSIKMLAIVVGVFAICWLPLNIFHLNSDFSSRVFDLNTFFICHWFAMSSVCYNPFIYFWLNRHYRQEIKQIVRCASMSKSSEVPNINYKPNNHHQHNNVDNLNHSESAVIQQQPKRVADRSVRQLTCLKGSNNHCHDLNAVYHKGRNNKADQQSKSKIKANCDSNNGKKNCKILFRTRMGTTNTAVNNNSNNYVPTPTSSSNSGQSFRSNEKCKLHRSNAVRKIGSNSRSNNASYCSSSS